MKASLALDKQLIRARFAEKAGRGEDDTLVSEVGMRLLEHLDPIRLTPARVLDMGCGSGRTLPLLRQRYPRATVIGLDVAQTMLVSTHTHTDDTLLVCSDAEQLGIADGTIDLLHCNLTLSWCNELERAVTEFLRLLRPGGLLLLSTLGPDTLKELRDCFAQHDDAPHVHSFPDMHDLGDLLQRVGFADVVIDAERLTFEYRVIERLFADLRAWGVGNAALGRRRTLTGPARMRAVIDAYESLRGDNGMLPASWEITYAHAWVREAAGVTVPRVDFNPLRRRRLG